MLDGSGAFDRVAATGKLSLSAASASMDPNRRAGRTIVACRRGAPCDVAHGPGSGALKLALDVAKNASQADHASLTAALTIDGPQLAGSASVTATPPLDAVRAFNLDALRASEFALTTKLSSPQGRNLTALLGLDAIVSADTGAAQFDATVNGSPAAPLRLTAKLSGAAVDADMQGTAEPFADPRKAALNVTGSPRQCRADVRDLAIAIGGQRERLVRAVAGPMNAYRQRLNWAKARPGLKHPREKIARARADVARLGTRVRDASVRRVKIERRLLAAHRAQLHALDPQRVLERGYALLLDEKGALITQVAQLKNGQAVRAQLADGSANLRVETEHEKK